MRMKHLQDYIDRLEIVRFEDFKEEKQIALKLLEEALQYQDDTAEAYAYCYLLDCCISIEDPIEARYYMIHALNICEQLQNADLLLLVYHLCGLYYYYNYDEPSALDYFGKALSFAKQLHAIKKEASILNNIANLFHNHNDFEDAILYYQKAYELCESFQDEKARRIRFIILSNIITIKVKQHDPIQARYYMELAEEMKEEFPILHLCNAVLVAFAEQKTQEVVAYMDEMFSSYNKPCYPLHQVFDFFHEVIPIAISLQDEPRAKKALMILCETSNSTNANQMMIVQEQFINISEAFPCVYDRNMLYKDYFHLVKKAAAQSDKVKAQSYREKMLLNDLLAQNHLLKQKVGYDEVTQLKNRHSFHMDIKDVMEREEITHIGIAMCDIDNFKECNDRFGHLYGDHIIKKMADILSQHADDDIIPYRFGGDEFLCLFINKSKKSIQDYLEEIFHVLKQQQEKLQISAGYAYNKKHKISSNQELIAQADKALYEAKNSGKNQFMEYQNQEA